MKSFHFILFLLNFHTHNTELILILILILVFIYVNFTLGSVLGLLPYIANIAKFLHTHSNMS